MTVRARDMDMDEQHPPRGPGPADEAAAWARALLDEADAAASDEDAAIVLRRAATVLEAEVGDPPRAFSVLLVAFGKDPANVGLVADLERLADRLGRLEDLLQAADGAMLAAADPAALADLWARVARWARRVGHHERALVAAESALHIAPAHQAGLGELEEAHRALGQWAALARALARRAASLSHAPDEHRDVLLALHLQLAALYEERLGDDDQAIASCQRAFALDPTDHAALVRLERLAARRERTGLLLDTLERRLATTAGPSERLEVGLRLAATWEREGRGDAACRVYDLLLAGGTDDRRLFEAAARAYADAGHLDSHVDVNVRRLGRAVGDGERAALSFEIGKTLMQALGRAEEGAAYVEQALATDPEHAEAAELLADHHRRSGQWAPLCARLLETARGRAPVSVRVQALLEGAAIYRGKLGDDRTARDLWNQVVALDPHNEEAASTVAADAEARHDWPRVRALLRPLCAAAEASDERRAEWHDRLARAAGAEGTPDDALDELRAAATLTPDDLPRQAALASALVASGRLTEAAPLLERLWAARSSAAWGATDDEIGALSCRLGHARRAAGDVAGAATAFEHGSALRPDDPEALDALVSLAESLGDGPACAAWKHARLRLERDPERAVILARELAALHVRLGARDAAIATLRESLAQHPDAPELMHDLVDLLVATESWREAVDLHLACSRADQGPARARHLVSAAHILSGKLGDEDGALELYNDALDEDPEDYKTFERIDRLLSRKRRFRDQEQAYRMMLYRVRDRHDPRSHAAKLLLWRGLGEIYRTRLRDFRAAASAFEMVAKLEGGPTATTGVSVILSELYELQGPEAHHRAIDERRKSLVGATDARDMSGHLRAIKRIALGMRDGDRAWRATDALVALDMADEDDRRFHRSRVADLQLPEGPMPDAAWSRLTHDDAGADLSHLFSAVGRGLIALRSRDLEGWGLRTQSREEQDDVERSVLGRLLTHMAGVLHVPRPQLQFRPDLPGTADMAGVRGNATVSPTLVAGADMLRVRSKRELASVMAKKVALMRPEHYVLWPTVVPTLAELRVMVVALRRLVEGNRTTALRPELERILPPYERALRRVLGPRDLERAAAVLPSLSLEASEVVGWARGAFLTASRVGYLVASDLETSLKTASIETVGSLRVTPFEQIRDLVTWSLSDDHSSLRRQLGLAPVRPIEPAGGRLTAAPPSRIVYEARAPRPLYDAYGAPQPLYDADGVVGSPHVPLGRRDDTAETAIGAPLRN